MVQSVKKAQTDSEIALCFNAMKALRPHLAEDSFVALIRSMQSDGYHLIYIIEGTEAIAACGYRYTRHLAWGRPVYIDDLTTLPSGRKKGYARRLLDFVKEEALSNGCDQMHLDSGTTPQRYDAHRLYLSYGFNITSLHFAMHL